MKKLLMIFIALATIFTFSCPVYASEVDWNFLNWNNLDYGMYWYTTGNVPHKAVKGEVNPGFDPSKPTVIYIHGWQPGFTLVKHRESFYIYGEDAADAWINAGYNVGVLYWNQFSDELNVEDAEAKIWTPNGPKGMRWRMGNGEYSTENSPTTNAAELIYKEYASAMEGYSGNEIRIVGHSLGSQMAIRLTKLISDNVDSGNIKPELLPKRVALLDPYFSNGAKDYLNGATTGDTCTSYVNELISKDNIPFEMYRSSYLTQGIAGDENKPLEKLCAYSLMKPWFDTSTQELERHMDAKYTYFSSFAVNTPKEYINLLPSGKDAASSKTSDIRIAQMMGPVYHWEQFTGMFTTDPSDDNYKRITDDNNYTAVTALELNKLADTIKVNEYDSIIASVSPESATNKMIIWKSDNPSVAEVCVNGTIKGISKGQANIIATTADGEIQKICTVNVIN